MKTIINVRFLGSTVPFELCYDEYSFSVFTLDGSVVADGYFTWDNSCDHMVFFPTRMIGDLFVAPFRSMLAKEFKKNRKFWTSMIKFQKNR